MEITICILLLALGCVSIFAVKEYNTYKDYHKLAENRHINHQELLSAVATMLDNVGMTYKETPQSSGSIVRSYKRQIFRFNLHPALHDGFYIDGIKFSAPQFVAKALEATKRCRCKRSIAGGCYLTEAEIRNLKKMGDTLSSLIESKTG